MKTNVKVVTTTVVICAIIPLDLMCAHVMRDTNFRMIVTMYAKVRLVINTHLHINKIYNSAIFSGKIKLALFPPYPCPPVSPSYICLSRLHLPCFGWLDFKIT